MTDYKLRERLVQKFGDDLRRKRVFIKFYHYLQHAVEQWISPEEIEVDSPELFFA